MRRTLTVVGALVVIVLVLRLGGPLVVTTKAPPIDLVQGADERTLVVVLHGFGGISYPGLIRLAHAAFPNSHLIAPLYSTGGLKAFSNRSPYDIADVLELAIEDAYQKHRYERIVLIGHSMGGEMMRKVFLWGAGEEEDRPARRGRHQWVDHVDRFVSLAAINRGWSIDPAPSNMPWYRRAEYAIGTGLGWLTGTGSMIYAVQRGAPFVADSRVQWIRLARQNATRMPLVIHLLGTQDDIATAEDTKDAQAAKDFKFKSLPDTGHADIATALSEELGPNGALTTRAQTILDCVTLPAEKIAFDQPDKLDEDSDVRRVVFILHGIRDYDVWGIELKRQIDEQLKRQEREQPGASASTVVLVPKYGYFPMAPFLLWSDRQKNVRWFMDFYTEALARYPKATQFDFIGHSNGTYILASALQKYRTLRVDDVYFAGSVVPQRYPWADLVQRERVRRVRNVVASNDWVVALFPRFFEQIAEWRGRAADPGQLDIGAAGFRGFQDAGRPGDAVLDIAFAEGQHSTGVDLRAEGKRNALVRFGQYGLDDTQERLFDQAFRTSKAPNTFMDQLSNVSWLVWLLLLSAVGAGALLVWKWKRYLVVVYVLLVLGILNSF